MLAQFSAGLVHFADYKRCKVLGDLLGVDDPTTGPVLDHRAALFLYRLLAELRAVCIPRRYLVPDYPSRPHTTCFIFCAELLQAN